MIPGLRKCCNRCSVQGKGRQMNVAKLAFKTIIACICAFLLLVAAGYYFRTEKERAVNDYVAAAYAQTCSMVYVGGYLPDDTQTYAVRLNDAEEPTFLVVLQGKEVIQDTYLLACMSKEIVQNWADAFTKYGVRVKYGFGLNQRGFLKRPCRTYRIFRWQINFKMRNPGGKSFISSRTRRWRKPQLRRGLWKQKSFWRCGVRRWIWMQHG